MKKQTICPWWIGYILLNPLRKIGQNPYKLLGSYLKPGMKVVDYGSAMGYFSLPMAKMVGSTGKVYCFDIQEKMLSKLISRAKSENLDFILEPRLATENNSFSDLNQSIDFALLFYVAHEVPNQNDLFRKLALMLKPGALLYFEEPKGHITLNDFEESVKIAERNGFKRKESSLNIGKRFAILLENSGSLT